MYVVRSKGGALGICQGWATNVTVLWWCIWGRGLRGTNATCRPLGGLSVISFTTHKQIGPFRCWFLGGLVYVCSRALWVSPMNSPVRLGVSSATTTPTGFFNQRFWGFISLSWNPRLCGLSGSPVVPPSLSTCKCGTTQSTSCHLTWSSSCHLACPSPPATALPWVLSALTACLHPFYRSEWMFLL